MEFKEYIGHCRKTESILPESMRLDHQTLSDTLKIAVASSNLVDLLKKRIFYGREVDKNGVSVNKLAVDNLTTITSTAEGLIDEGGAYIADEESRVNLRYAHGVIGIFTEAGELVEGLQKHLGGAPLDTVNLLEELGDITWYLSILCDALNLDFNEILEKNIAKLAKRYGGEFSSEKANNRDISAELDILEGKSLVGALGSELSMLSDFEEGVKRGLESMSDGKFDASSAKDFYLQVKASWDLLREARIEVDTLRTLGARQN